ncbi:MAG TPA: hypothetical protein VG755_19670 [Nannocystaceae bacterium]|nr:hypothetical protein [Nannocystaceae bacterium]
MRCIVWAAVAVGAAGCDMDPLIHQDNVHTQEQYEKSARNWTKWALQQDWSTGPILDTDGSACALGQKGRTWFLAGTTGGPVERECTIPHGKKIFFPLVNRWVAPRPTSIIEGDPENDLAAWVAFVTEYFAGNRASTCSLTLRLEGHDLLPDLETMDEELYVEILDPFAIIMTDDNFSTPFGGLPGERTTWVDGHWALLEPLPPGDYTLEFGGSTCDENDEVDFETLATYTLHIEEED